ncbi:elongation factor P [Anaerocaecibacter muris]|uniref:elongation factor P n=1 Tax=Anaerocaecibacter muris TaxID=2941513 RepID=UPI00203D80BC|nr:elongation factor P [Anaerocaecibacter muris]
MVSAGDFRKGTTFEMEGKVYTVVEFQHVKPGKGSAFVRTKIKNVITGQVLENTFNPSDKYEEAHIDRREYQYSYNDGDLYYFMDTETFDMLPLNHDLCEDALRFIKEEMTVTISSYKGSPFAVEPPNFVELEIADTEGGIQGDTSKPGNKPATLETGYTIGVPLFVNIGDKIRVDTRTGTYMERVK